MEPSTTATPLTTESKGASGSSSSKAKRDRFLSVFPRIREEVLQHLCVHHMPDDAKAWYKRNIEYNVPGGKLNRGMAVIDTVEIIRGKPLADEEYYEVAVLGWSVEFLQSYFLVEDDIMDSSITRRDQPCWYRVSEPARVGMTAINDGCLLESIIFYLCKRHFRGRRYYADLLELFHDVIYLTELGQLVDLITAPEDAVDLSRFSLTKHRFIVVYKTAYYSFYLPVALAMMHTGIPVPQELPSLANTIKVSLEATNIASNGHVEAAPTVNDSQEPYQLALDILLPLGEYFQVQDDYLDCFGVDIGKIGTDILDNKCSWVICTALELATAEQRLILDENYGRKDSVREARCKDVFEAMRMRERYATYEEDGYQRINALIDRVQETDLGEDKVALKKDVFRSFLQKIYRRQK